MYESECTSCHEGSGPAGGRDTPAVWCLRRASPRGAPATAGSARTSSGRPTPSGGGGERVPPKGRGGVRSRPDSVTRR
ncbi:hypothetical protein [Streptomyces goshikiensis]